MKPLVLRNFPGYVQHEGYDGLIDMFIFELTDNKWHRFYFCPRTALNMVLTCVRSHRSTDDFPTAFCGNYLYLHVPCAAHVIEIQHASFSKQSRCCFLPLKFVEEYCVRSHVSHLKFSFMLSVA